VGRAGDSPLGLGCLATTLVASLLSSARAGDETSPASVLLDAPLDAPRLSFFHAALDVPPLQSARPLPSGSVKLALESNHARSVERRDVDGIENHFDGLYHEWAVLDLAGGFLSRFEAGARLPLAGWGEQLDTFSLFDDAGNPIVEDEAVVINGTGASKRHTNLSALTLRLKGALVEREQYGFDLSLAGSVKIPIARPRDLTNAGTTDLGATLLASVPMGPLTLHLNAGVGVPLGQQNIFVDQANVDLDVFFHGGLALAWTLPRDWAVVAQLAGNTSAFRDVQVLDGGPLTAMLGVRKLFDRLAVEVGGGTGLIARSSYDYEIHVAVAYLFGP
jgi:hypothetical protein